MAPCLAGEKRREQRESGGCTFYHTAALVCRGAQEPKHRRSRRFYGSLKRDEGHLKVWWDTTPSALCAWEAIRHIYMWYFKHRGTAASSTCRVTNRNCNQVKLRRILSACLYSFLWLCFHTSVCENSRCHEMQFMGTWLRFGFVTKPTYQPRVSEFDELGMRVKNQLSYK